MAMVMVMLIVVPVLNTVALTGDDGANNRHHSQRALLPHSCSTRYAADSMLLVAIAAIDSVLPHLKPPAPYLPLVVARLSVEFLLRQAVTKFRGGLTKPVRRCSIEALTCIRPQLSIPNTL